jgi:hypothetical protein
VRTLAAREELDWGGGHETDTASTYHTLQHDLHLKRKVFGEVTGGWEQRVVFKLLLEPRKQARAVLARSALNRLFVLLVCPHECRSI